MPSDAISALNSHFGAYGLAENGIVHPDEGGSVVLLSPAPSFWSIFSESFEYRDGAEDPMDRWSARVITELAAELNAEPVFPFSDPPAPFFTWAQHSGQAWQSPVQLLVGSEMGLNVSYRGGLKFEQLLTREIAERPCETCSQPCVTACPAGALTADGYDVPACKAFLADTPDAPCLTLGCAVRRACPVSRLQPPPHAQFHMEAFLG